MRTIKFRGKRVDNGEWVYGYLLKHSSRTEILVSHSDKILDYDTYRITPETVGQFTGLLDKNGKEIYEGDVVDSHSRYDQPYIREVFWGEKCGLEFKTLTGYKLCKSNEPHFEIIGNIHDNPELLTNG